jgi:hypothetical protein
MASGKREHIPKEARFAILIARDTTNFLELRHRELRRTRLPRTRVNKGTRKGRNLVIRSSLMRTCRVDTADREG